MTRARETYTRSPKKSTTHASVELQVPQKTVRNILRIRLRMFPYRLQLLQNLTENDKILRHSFCMFIQQRNEASNDFFFGDESTFHISGTVNKHNVRIWGTEKPRAVVERVRDSPKVNVCCAASRKTVCPCKLQGVLFKPWYTQKNGAVSKVNKNFISQLTQSQRTQKRQLSQVSHALITNLQCVHPGSHDTHPYLPWPPRSPDLTPRDFFLWGFIKDSVYVPPLSTSIHELRDRIMHALQAITADMLQRVWDESDYRVDVCRVTQHAHIEGL
ncbi:hypothetical protein B7P43_G02649 [Cryptotermes secundus]|uniref:Uncharacterized protein n=1 Tax=Cryptotermes secundus TaxID=105785 RepID=A0A2J7QCD9_9NEOP|nr:hypothetical protein B7P43_G02649 [Cryptotermes secundus]